MSAQVRYCLIQMPRIPSVTVSATLLRFCNTCIRSYVEKQVMTSISVGCPVQQCLKPLSVRDMKVRFSLLRTHFRILHWSLQDLLPKKPKQDEFGSQVMRPTSATQQATQRLIAELTHIVNSHPEKSGYSVDPIDDNMYLWELKLFNFDKNTEPLAQDLIDLRMDFILLRIAFPPTYPLNPPFVRVIKPRFAFRTGHVTIGGSICTELLTNKGWSPANTIEAVIMSVRAGFQEGNARLDLHHRHEYTEAEAKDAFNRMVQTHGWY
jgi:ubiquitin-protein ligase